MKKFLLLFIVLAISFAFVSFNPKSKTNDVKTSNIQSENKEVLIVIIEWGARNATLIYTLPNEQTQQIIFNGNRQELYLDIQKDLSKLVNNGWNILSYNDGTYRDLVVMSK